VPGDLGSFYRQQLKWARGVFEVSFAELPRAIARLTWRQSLAYLAIGTYYLFGLTTLAFIVFPYVYLWTGYQPAAMRWADFLLYAGPVGVIGTAIYLYSQRWMSGGAAERGLHLRGLMLKIACWPVYLAGTLLAIVRAEIPYVPTAKRAVRGSFVRLAWPHLLLITLYAATLAHVLRQRLFETSEGMLELTSEAVWGMMAFAAIPLVTSVGALIAAAQSARAVRSPDPWTGVDVASIGGPA
jgi:cellulose synthase (UDP-forming)